MAKKTSPSKTPSKSATKTPAPKELDMDKLDKVAGGSLGRKPMFP